MLRALLVWTHRWVGLTLGLIPAVVCVSGSSLLFQEQYWEWAHGHLTPPGMPGEVQDVGRWVEQGRAALPELGLPVAVWPPHTEHNLSRAGMPIFGGRPPGGLGNMGFLAVLVAPSTGDVLGIVDVDRSPAYAPLFLHRDLWTGATGRIVSGVAGVGTLVLLTAGLFLWWPARGTLARKLTGRPWRVTLRFARPLHDWVGIWTLIPFTVLVVSGLVLVQPTWTEPIVTAAAGPEPAETTAQPASTECRSAIDLTEAIGRAVALVPGGSFKGLYPADDTGRRWEVVVRGGASHARARETHVSIEPACGLVAVEATPITRSRHEAVEMWMSDVHDGSAFGGWGPLVVSLCGLSPLVLFWSGVRMWLRGRRSRSAFARAA